MALYIKCIHNDMFPLDRIYREIQQRLKFIFVSLKQKCICRYLAPRQYFKEGIYQTFNSQKATNDEMDLYVLQKIKVLRYTGFCNQHITLSECSRFFFNYSFTIKLFTPLVKYSLIIFLVQMRQDFSFLQMQRVRVRHPGFILIYLLALKRWKGKLESGRILGAFKRRILPNIIRFHITENGPLCIMLFPLLNTTCLFLVDISPLYNFRISQIVVYAI